MTEFNEVMTRQVEAILNSFPEVQWDRWSGDPSRFMVFGWIERKDSHADFATILVEGGSITQIMTSSPLYSRVFSERAGFGHLDCHRVERCFRNTRHVRLSDTRGK